MTYPAPIDETELGAVRFATVQFVETLAPAVAELPASMRLAVVDSVMLELVARLVGPIGTVEHLRLLADICEASHFAQACAKPAGSH